MRMSLRPAIVSEKSISPRDGEATASPASPAAGGSDSPGARQGTSPGPRPSVRFARPSLHRASSDETVPPMLARCINANQEARIVSERAQGIG